MNCGDLNIDLNISVKNDFTLLYTWIQDVTIAITIHFSPNLNYHNFMVTDVCNTMYVYIYAGMDPARLFFFLGGGRAAFLLCFRAIFAVLRGIFALFRTDFVAFHAVFGPFSVVLRQMETHYIALNNIYCVFCYLDKIDIDLLNICDFFY